jgi:hypothetical protein
MLTEMRYEEGLSVLAGGKGDREGSEEVEEEMVIDLYLMSARCNLGAQKRRGAR